MEAPLIVAWTNGVGLVLNMIGVGIGLLFWISAAAIGYRRSNA
jgi:hypothetical protein